jgi:hypothetical protein
MNKPMPIIDEEGKYVYVENTRLLKLSTHPVYRARIEVALEQGTWIGAPQAGSQLGRFRRVRQSEHQVEEFQKALAYYLSAYPPRRPRYAGDPKRRDLRSPNQARGFK